MMSFILHIVISLFYMGIGSMLFGFSLQKVFKKCAISPVKAYIPFVNILTWIKLTKNPWWFIVLLLQPYYLPGVLPFSLSIFVLAKVTLDTASLFEKQQNTTLKTIGSSLLAGILYTLFKDSIFGGSLIFFLFVGFSSFTIFKYGLSIIAFNKKAYASKEFSFKEYASRQFRKNKAALASVYILGALIVLALYSPYIANNQPLYVSYAGKTYFPAYSTSINPAYSDSIINPTSGKQEKLQFDITEWKQLQLDDVVWAPIPYSPSTQDIYNSDYANPSGVQEYMNPDGDIVPVTSRFRHHMGTDAIGRDVTSGLIHGSKISLLVGVVSMGIAALIGIILGAFAGFYGDKTYRAPRIRIVFSILGLILGFFYGFIVRAYTVSLAFEKGPEEGFSAFGMNVLIFLTVTFGMRYISKFFAFGFLKKEVNIPIDSYVSRSIEILNSMPRLLLIITIAAIVKERSMLLLMVIIGVTSWTGIARFTRAEFLRIRELEYVQAARALGYNDWRVVMKHALPNALAPVFVSIAFGIASAILIESSLSFLGIGVPDDVVTWGSLLSIGRQEFEAWWLVMYPGFAIFITITIYNLIGEGLRDALDPKLKK